MSKKNQGPLQGLIPQHIDKIKSYARAELQARGEARERLNRLKQKASEFEESGVEIMVKIHELQEGLAEAIAGDAAISEITKIRKKISSLKIDASEHEIIATNLRKKAIPQAEAELRKINDQLSKGIAAQLDVCRAQIEAKAAELFDAILANFAQWDTGVDELLRGLDARMPDIGLIGGSERLALRITSEAVVKHFQAFFALDLSIDEWRRQLNERHRKIQPVTENKDEDPQQKAAVG